MLPIADRYSFEAEWSDGQISRRGGDIKGAIKVSLIPASGTNLPRHDLIGQPFVHRFMRYFKRNIVGGFDKERYWAELEKNVSTPRLEAREARDSKGIYSPPNHTSSMAKPIKLDEAIQVVVTETCRFYVRHFDGAVLITPPDYELYL